MPQRRALRDIFGDRPAAAIVGEGERAAQAPLALATRFLGSSLALAPT
jgi:hypothetical protein